MKKLLVLCLASSVYLSVEFARAGDFLDAKSLYESKCAYCHGKEGRGDGPPANILNPKPRDFTTGSHRFRSTESGSIPTDEDLMNTIRKGLPGTSMPAMGSILKEEEIKSLVAYIKLFSQRFAAEKPKAVKSGPAISSSTSSIAAGKRVYEKLECAGCHGSDGSGADATVKDLVDENNLPITSTNLQEPWTFHGGSTARDVYLRIRTGLDGTPMASFKGDATDSELWHLSNYVLSLARKPAWSMTAEELKAFLASVEQKKKSDPVGYGRQLVNTLGCVDCHSPVRPGGAMISGFQLAGGQRRELYPFFSILVTPNLTSDKETGLGDKTDEQIRNALTKGIRSDGSRMLPFPMPWTAYAKLKEEDLRAVIAYLRTVPPVYNKIPKRETPNIVSYLWGKFRMLILKSQDPEYIYYGNAGTQKTPVISANMTDHEKEKRPRTRP
jgi:mono/diheme cytochrome c family protein